MVSEYARAASIPDEIWNMDSRAGAATEAEEALANLEAISDNLTHSDSRTTGRYIRLRTNPMAIVRRRGYDPEKRMNVVRTARQNAVRTER